MLDTKPWVTFLAVAGFIICGLLVLSGVGIILGVEGFGEKTPPVGLLYFLITFLCAVPSLALWRVGASLRRLMRGDGMPALREAMSHMRSFFRLVGIMMLMMIALDLVALIYLATIPKVG